MEHIPYSQITKGTFLVASPDVEMGPFFRNVILICEHTHGGSFGLVINKSLDLEVSEDIIDIHHLTNKNVGIRAGGPVQTNQMMLLHTYDKLPQQTLQICDGVYLGGDLEFLQEVITDENGSPIYLCFGYTGWDAGQLEREFLDGNWFIHPATSRLIFYVAPDKLWSTILREMGGKYSPLSMIPEDLSMN